MGRKNTYHNKDILYRCPRCRKNNVTLEPENEIFTTLDGRPVSYYVCDECMWEYKELEEENSCKYTQSEE